MDKDDFVKLGNQLVDEIMMVRSTMQDKGWQRFIRPLVLGGIFLFGSYYLLYAPPVKKLAKLDGKIRVAMTTAKYADQYKELKLRLMAAYALMPAPKDRNGFLYSAILDSLKAENIVADGLQPPNERESNGLLFQEITITMTVKFSELYAWMARVENLKPMVHISSLQLTKKADPVGLNLVVCTLSTVIPKTRY